MMESLLGGHHKLQSFYLAGCTSGRGWTWTREIWRRSIQNLCGLLRRRGRGSRCRKIWCSFSSITIIVIVLMKIKFLSKPLDQVKDMVATSTKLVLIRQSSITSLDFWEGGQRVREVYKPQKLSTILPSTSAPTSKSTLAPEILGKRRLARESTKVKRRCCAFCWDRQIHRILKCIQFGQIWWI